MEEEEGKVVRWEVDEEEMREEGFMSEGCHGRWWGLQGLDLNMLGQCLLEEAMMVEH